jgi:outer membrane protein OmpA-like peptidoglycan-associated protein
MLHYSTGRADCIGQNGRFGSYIFAMCFRRGLLPRVLGALVLASTGLRADPNDVAGSRDYPGFPRPAGYTISDYDEDNPAGFTFSVSRPLPIDIDHMEKVNVRGHRYIIQYIKDAAIPPPTLLQLQQYYEKFAAANGFTTEKNGVVGDVSETFHKSAEGHDITIVESSGVAAPPTPSLSPVSPPVPQLRVTRISIAPTTILSLPAPAGPVTADPDGDVIYSSLIKDGRVIVPLAFYPGRNDLAESSEPVLDRIAAMLKKHSDLFLRIEGHTDNSGDPDDNLRLSARRAFAVQALLAKTGVDKLRLDPVGVGGLQPIADNDTADGRAKNRRIELVLRKKPASYHASGEMPSFKSAS